MQHLKLLKSFVAVARSRSIREAAEATSLTSSALNRRILDLESEVGSPLFERHARGTRLSSAGEIFLAYAERAIRDAEAAHSRVDDLRGLRRGHINLAVISVAANERLINLIAQFQQRHPMVSFSLHVAGSDEVVEAVMQHQADLGIGFNLGIDKDFHQLAERRHVMCAIVTSDSPLAQRASVSINECASLPVAIADRSWGGRRLLDEYLAKTGFRLTPQLVSNSYEMLIAFVRRTGGVTFQVRPQNDSSEIGGGLVAVPVTEMAPYTRHMVLGCLRGRVLPVAVALFSEELARDLFGSGG